MKIKREAGEMLELAQVVTFDESEGSRAADLHIVHSLLGTVCSVLFERAQRERACGWSPSDLWEIRSRAVELMREVGQKLPGKCEGVKDDPGADAA